MAAFPFSACTADTGTMLGVSNCRMKVSDSWVDLRDIDLSAAITQVSCNLKANPTVLSRFSNLSENEKFNFRYRENLQEKTTSKVWGKRQFART